MSRLAAPVWVGPGLIVGLLLAGCGLFRKLPPPSLPPVTVEMARAPRSEAPRPAAFPGAPENQVVVERVVAIVNQDAITLSELQEAMAYFLQQNKEKKEQGKELEERVLHRLVENRLQVQEALKEKLEVSDEEIKETIDDLAKKNNMSLDQFKQALTQQGLVWESFRREIREQILTRKIVRRKISNRVSITEGEVDQYFRENRAKFETSIKFRARHIALLVPTDSGEEVWQAVHEKAVAFVGQLRDGASFEEMAKKESQDPTAKDGGDLGTLSPGEVQPQFEEAILKLEAGQVTDPVRSSQGYHIFRLEWREELTPENITQIRQQIREILYRQKFQQRFDAWIEELRKRSMITLKGELAKEGEAAKSH